MKSYQRLSFKERIRISVYLDEGFSIAEIARKLGRTKSTVFRDVSRCKKAMGEYNAGCANAESRYLQSERRFGQRKLANNHVLFEEVLSGLRKRWSPVQISKMLKEKYPGDREMNISHESIYTYIYVLPRGELRAELTRLLRQKQKYRSSRKGTNEKRGRIPEMISIEERPKNVRRRSLAGHWEGDLLMGKASKSALGTLVERKTRTVILVPLKGRTASVVRKAFERAVKTLPQQMRLSLTYDQGSEMSEHQLFQKNTKMKVYFCHPSSPWERGTCENTNGLLRDYFPKQTDFSAISRKEIKRVQDELNERPRKTLGFKTPKEVFEKEVLSVALET